MTINDPLVRFLAELRRGRFLQKTHSNCASKLGRNAIRLLAFLTASASPLVAAPITWSADINYADFATAPETERLLGEFTYDSEFNLVSAVDLRLVDILTGETIFTYSFARPRSNNFIIEFFEADPTQGSIAGTSEIIIGFNLNGSISFDNAAPAEYAVSNFRDPGNVALSSRQQCISDDCRTNTGIIFEALSGTLTGSFSSPGQSYTNPGPGGIFDVREFIFIDGDEANDGEVRIARQTSAIAGLEIRSNASFVNTGVISNGIGPILGRQGTRIVNRGTFVNNGSIANLGGAEFSNFGNFSISSGRVDNDGDWTNSVSITIENDGEFNNTGLFANRAGGIVRQDGKFSNTGVVANAAGAEFNNQGNFSISSGRVDNDGDWTNSVSITIENDGEFNNTGLFANRAGGIVALLGPRSRILGGQVVNNGEIVSANGAAISYTGNVSGVGVFRAQQHKFSGSLNSGNSPGLATLDGNVVFEDGFDLIAEITGTDRGDLSLPDGIGFDAIDIFGGLTIEDGANLDFSILNNSQIDVGASFDLIYATTFIEGMFSNVSDGWSLFYETGRFGSSGQFAAALRAEFIGAPAEIPLPPASILFFMGLAGIAARKRRTAK